MDRMRVAQPQHTAMIEELDLSHQREQAATQGAAPDRRADATGRSGLPGIDTKLLGHPDAFHGEDEKWFEWVTVFRSAFCG